MTNYTINENDSHERTALEVSGSSPPDIDREQSFAAYLAARGADAGASIGRVRTSAVLLADDGAAVVADATDPTLPRVEPLAFDFEAAAEPPRFVVDGMFKRSTVNLVSGDTGAAKSIAMQALTVAGLQGRSWLGRDVDAARVLYVDEENAADLVTARLRAMGMTNADRDGLRYVNRAGVQVGAEVWNKWLRREALAHKADLIVIDTVTSATGVDFNDNAAVAALFTPLKVLATEGDLAVVLLAHERKRQVGQTRDRSQATLGARAWVNQADHQVTMAFKGRESTPRPDEGTDLRSEFELAGGKDRTFDDDGRPELIVVTSRRDPERRLHDLRITSAGAIVPEMSALDEMVADVLAAVEAHDRPEMRTAEIADAIPVDAADRTFKRALRDTAQRGQLVKPARGVYALPTAGEAGGLDVS